ncbi:MAG: hypothetical protein R2712_05375 [Vicinamibacterales bacterium]
MAPRYSVGRQIARMAAMVLPVAALAVPALVAAQSATPPAAAPPAVTFTRHIAPILQRSCENCHRADGVAPMALTTYEEVRPWARAIKQRTGIGPHAGVMPPWYVEREIGIQRFKNDPSLTEDEIALIARWVDSGAPRGEAGDMPAARDWNDSTKWQIGQPDLVIRTDDITVKGGSPDWWGEIDPVATGLTEDRYVAALEVREVNDVSAAGTGRDTVGGRYVFHHMIWSTKALDAPSRRRRPMASTWPPSPEWTPTPRRGPCTRWDASPTSSTPSRRACCARAPTSSRTRSTSTRTAATRRHTWRSASSSCRRATRPSTSPRASRSATAWTSTSRRWKRASSCTPTPC